MQELYLERDESTVLGKRLNIYESWLQVYCSVLGWMDFRACGISTFQYVNAAMNPKYLLSSGSMSENSLVMVAGVCYVCSCVPVSGIFFPQGPLV